MLVEYKVLIGQGAVLCDLETLDVALGAEEALQRNLQSPSPLAEAWDRF